MIGMSGVDMPARSARAQIGSAINVVIQIARLADGTRRLTSLSEITGLESDVITMQEIFRYRIVGRDEGNRIVGHFEATGIRPRFLDQMHTHGVYLPADLFRPELKVG